MFCTKCGAQLDDDARFCTSCGATVEAEEPAQPDCSGQQPYQPYSPEVYADPAPSFEPSEQEPKKKPKLWVFLAAGGAGVLIIVLLILALTGGGGGVGGSSAGSPEKVMKQYFKAQFNGDLEASSKYTGLDYKEKMKVWYEDEDDVEDEVDRWLDYVLEWYFDDVDMDEDKWESRVEKIEDVDDLISFRIDISAAYQKAYNEEYERSYEIKKLDVEKLESRKDEKAAKEYVEEWYEEWEDADMEDALLFDLDNIKSYYTVEYKVRTEEDGDHDNTSGTALVVKTSKGCFIITMDYDD